MMYSSDSGKAPRENGGDWHPAYIVAALRAKGWSLRRLSVDRGYHPTTLAVALHRDVPKYERIIASTIGVAPEEIWPSRYSARATREAARVRRSQRHSAKKSLAAKESAAKAQI